MRDGVGTVDVPEEVIKDAEPLWEDFLIGKFLAAAPHIAKVHAIVNKIWALNDKNQMIEVFTVNATTMKFRILNPAVRSRILRRGMWNLAEIPVVMTKWVPFVEEKLIETESIPMWVHMRNVPMNMFSWKGLSFVSSPLGTPVRLHPETAQCLNLKVAKIFVNVDLTKDLPKKMKFTFQGKETLVEYTYPWLPVKCHTCEKWGHTTKVCLVNRGKQQEEKQSEDGHESGGLIKENEATETNTVEEVSDKEEEREDLTENNGVLTGGENHRDVNDGVSTQDQESGKSQNSEKHVVSDNMEHVGDQENKTMEVESQNSVQLQGDMLSLKGISESSGKNNIIIADGEWMDVTPSKGSRSPNKLKKTLEFGQVSILSNSRFSVLSPTEEEGEIMEVAEDSQGKEKETEELQGKEVEVEIKDQNKDSTVVKQVKEKDVVIPRQSLPRGSKDNHKFLGDGSVQKAQDVGPSGLNKKKSRKNL
ncbi:hypothetical protein N665_0119s0002 [Sinapis alba]|nr:hypothetical protein N665_0119s0002 [Sinapis alba]